MPAQVPVRKQGQLVPQASRGEKWQGRQCRLSLPGLLQIEDQGHRPLHPQINIRTGIQYALEIRFP